jgi:hypothetical protein
VNRPQMLIARDRIAKLVGQIEALSWNEQTVGSKWLILQLKPVESDVHNLTWERLTAETPRRADGKFKAKK